MRIQKGFMILCLLLLTACQAEPVQPPLRTTLSELYPGIISNADRIRLIDGSSGHRIWINDSVEVQEWINQIKDVEWVPEEPQEGAVGNIYRMELYEGEDMKLKFTPQQMDRIYYVSDPKFMESVNSLFEEKFEKDF
ncbi:MULTISPECIES: hypothetical protein [unclassified Paenibacillus]|uniref:Uncharacterized protein n=1 Tax=Paenibacillus provencensis TaxID=441151 RepID=A0ABW3QAR9_9BACL|nr:MULTISPECIES: hypothetical protein [unclassified Paenibacillus]MCM3128179.1 hypothetical protein [Paenibacillus sp. MER 78]SFS83225.1 hypothetical protein SAMN04488601_104191 [Paenibacillus sp. 453mf]